MKDSVEIGDAYLHGRSNFRGYVVCIWRDRNANDWITIEGKLSTGAVEERSFPLVECERWTANG